MELSDQDIKEYLKKGRINIKPLKNEQIGSASVDLTLSNEWYLFKEKYIGKRVDLEKTRFEKVFDKKKADAVLLNPGEMCLGKTIEKITLPKNIMGRLEGRSRYARMGLIVHTTSALVQPGSDNHQILEIVNLSPFSIVIKKGMRISQITFSKMQTPTSKPYRIYGKIAKKQ